MTRFTWLDYSIFVVYLAGSVSVGMLFIKEQRTIKDYFLASRSMGYVLVGISVLAALFSGISYLGAPSEVYAHSMAFMLFGLSFLIATPVTANLFVPHFYHSRFYTAYQYLEERFSVQVRLLASSLFILRVLLWLALATYAPALALEQVTGLPLWFSIICTGTLTTALHHAGRHEGRHLDRRGAVPRPIRRAARHPLRRGLAHSRTDCRPSMTWAGPGKT